MAGVKSHLEEQFALLWQDLGGPELVREYRFHPTRRWRADFAHLPSRTLVEIEGIGRHNRVAGFLKDADKYWHAQALGWSVWRLTNKMLTPAYLRPIIDACTQTPSSGS